MEMLPSEKLGRGDFAVLSVSLFAVHRLSWPHEGMMGNFTALSTLWGDLSPGVLILEKNPNITRKVEKFYLSYLL